MRYKGEAILLACVILTFGISHFYCASNIVIVKPHNAAPPKCPDRMARIFIISAHKTASTSLINAMRKLHFNVYNGKWYYEMLLQEPWERLNNISHYIDTQVPRFEAFKDSPYNHGDNYRELYKHYPCAYFLNGVRPAELWASSLIRWSKRHYAEDLTLQRVSQEVFGIAIPGDEHLHQLVAWYDARNQRIRSHFTGNERFVEFTLEEMSWQWLHELFPWKAPLDPWPRRFPMSNQNSHGL